MPKTFDKIKLVKEIFKLLDAIKIFCKTSIRENMKYIKHNNEKTTEVRHLSDSIMSCLEFLEIYEVCQYFIAAPSKNIKKSISFTISILKTCIEDCNKITFDKNLKIYNIKYTANHCSKLIKLLNDLKDHT